MKVKTVSYKSKKVGQEFAESLHETGFAVLNEHPLPHDLITGIFDDWAKFFSQEGKHRYTFDPKLQSGYFPFRTENAKNYSVKDLKEFFHYYPWTALPPELASRTKDVYGRLVSLGGELLQMIEEYLPTDVKKTLSMPLRQMIEGSQDTLLRPIHYPPLTGSEEEGAIRAAAHEDINLITLLIAATAPGLEVKDNEGRWYAVECNPGELVINSGDMLKMATGGFYGSTTHRVVNPKGPHSKLPRYSMPLFLHPRKEVPLSKTQTAGSYLKERLEEIGLVKKN